MRNKLVHDDDGINLLLI